jgi:hypothetical protein
MRKLGSVVTLFSFLALAVVAAAVPMGWGWA